MSEENNVVPGEISEKDLLGNILPVAEAANKEVEIPKGNEAEQNMLARKTRDRKIETVSFEDLQNPGSVPDKKEETQPSPPATQGDEPKIYATGIKQGQHKKSCTCNECKIKRGEKVETSKPTEQKKEQQPGQPVTPGDKPLRPTIDVIAHMVNAPIVLITKKFFKDKNPHDTIISLEQQRELLLPLRPPIADDKPNWWLYIPALITTGLTNMLIGNKAASYSYEEKK